MGLRGFEPRTPWSSAMCSPGLSYSPITQNKVMCFLKAFLKVFSFFYPYNKEDYSCKDYYNQCNWP